MGSRCVLQHEPSARRLARPLVSLSTRPYHGWRGTGPQRIRMGGLTFLRRERGRLAGREETSPELRPSREVCQQARSINGERGSWLHTAPGSQAGGARTASLAIGRGVSFSLDGRGRGGMSVLPARLRRSTLAQAGHRSETYTLSSGTSSANQTCTFWLVVAQR